VRVLFLGTGTSHGVPMIGCDCDVCRSPDPRDKRFRASILVEWPNGPSVLVDTTPDLRSQALTHDIRRLDAVLVTHAHADHIMGLDELRRFNHIQHRAVPLYGNPATLAALRRTFDYVFSEEAPKGGGVPQVNLFDITGTFSVGGQTVVPVPIRHGPLVILGFRFGRFAYLTDCNAIPDASMALLSDLDVLVLDALRRRRHPTHFTLQEAVETARAVGARQTYFTHIAHDLGHAATSRELPDGMALAYDGLSIEVDDRGASDSARTD
jgi:phosphoribosyl 1,2-cyclic phosphate phosphodiesterase